MLTLDVPLAVLTVLFRRFIDSFHYNVPVQAAPVAPNSTALIILSSALYYLYKNLNRGTLVRLSSKNRQQVTSDIHPTSNKQKASSWLLRNLRGTRNKYTLAIRHFADQSMENLRACKALTNIGKIHTKASLNQPPQKPLQQQKRFCHHHLSHKHPSTTPRQDVSLDRQSYSFRDKEILNHNKYASNMHTSKTHKPIFLTPHRTRHQESSHLGRPINQRESFNPNSASLTHSHHSSKRQEDDKGPEKSTHQQGTSTHDFSLCQSVAKIQPQNVSTAHELQPNNQNQSQNTSYQQIGDDDFKSADTSCCHESCYHRQINKVSFEVQTEQPVMIDASTHSDMTLELKNHQHVIDLTKEMQVRRRDTTTNIGGGDERKKRGRPPGRPSGTKKIEKVQSNKMIKRKLRSGKTIASIT